MEWITDLIYTVMAEEKVVNKDRTSEGLSPTTCRFQWIECTIMSMHSYDGFIVLTTIGQKFNFPLSNLPLMDQMRLISMFQLTFFFMNCSPSPLSRFHSYNRILISIKCSGILWSTYQLLFLTSRELVY